MKILMIINWIRFICDIVLKWNTIKSGFRVISTIIKSWKE